MTEQHKTIIERVQKLLTLHQGATEVGSLAEAANAMEKAQALLMKHNLEMADITAHDPDSAQKMGKAIYREVTAKKNEGQWIYRLYQVLATHNFCSVIYTTFWDEKRGVKNKFVNLVGTKDNVIVVKFLAEQLESRLRVLEVTAWKQGKCYGEKRNAFRRGYLLGACTGIDSQLRYAKEKMMEESPQVNTLVVVNDAALQKAVSELFPRIRITKGGRNLKSKLGKSMGYQDGKAMNINQGISGNAGASRSIG